MALIPESDEARTARIRAMLRLGYRPDPETEDVVVSGGPSREGHPARPDLRSSTDGHG